MGFAQIEERGRRLAERALAIWPGPSDSRRRGPNRVKRNAAVGADRDDASNHVDRRCR